MDKHAYEFNEERHEYRIGGRVVPSVTQVLGDLLPGWKAAQWYLDRGRAVHAAAKMIAEGVDFDSDPQIDGQVTALRKFFREVKPIVIACEMPVYSVCNQYAGQLDLMTLKPGCAQLMVVDFKASFSGGEVYQCSGYANAYDQMPDSTGCPVKWGCAVEIRDGQYRMSEIWDLRRFKAEWWALLATFNIRKRLGKTEKEGTE